jgi:hypothetical protein
LRMTPSVPLEHLPLGKKHHMLPHGCLMAA